MVLYPRRHPESDKAEDEDRRVKSEEEDGQFRESIKQGALNWPVTEETSTLGPLPTPMPVSGAAASTPPAMIITTVVINGAL